MSLRIGAKLPSSGAGAHDVPLRSLARKAEEAGFDSLWVSDHVVMPRHVSSRYPFSRDGTMSWQPEEPWYDALVSMATAAAVTHRVEIGVGVLIVPMRNPLILAKQIASLDALSGGRVTLGAGAGWLEEEFRALNAPFEERGSRLDEWIEIMRDCWSGTPQFEGYRHYHVSDQVLSYPTPAHRVPVLIGGMSPAALRRVARLGDGWFALQHAEAIDVSVLNAGLEAIENEAQLAGRAAPKRLAIRMPGSTSTIARHISVLADAGVTDLVVDVEWDEKGPGRTVEALRSGLT